MLVLWAKPSDGVAFQRPIVQWEMILIYGHWDLGVSLKAHGIVFTVSRVYLELFV